MRLRLDDRVLRYLKPFNEPVKENITIEELLLHESGFGPGIVPRGKELPASMLERAFSHPLAGPRGKFSYSDVGYIALAEIVKNITGAPLSQFMAPLFERWHMPRTWTELSKS